MVIFIYNELYAYEGIYWAKWGTNYRRPIQILKKVACVLAVGNGLLHVEGDPRAPPRRPACPSPMYLASWTILHPSDLHFPTLCQIPSSRACSSTKCPVGTLTCHHTCDLGLAVSSAEKDTAIKATKQLLKGKQEVATCFRRMAGTFSLITTVPEQGQWLIH